MITKIKNWMLIKYYRIINKLATFSPLYKQLYNRVEYNKLVYENLENIIDTIKDLPSLKILTTLIKHERLSTVNLKEFEIYKYSQKGDILLYNPNNTLEEVVKKYNKPEGKFVLIEDLEKCLNQEISKDMVFIPCNIWMKDLLKVNNLLYTILKEKGRFEL